MPAGFRFPDDSALWIPFGIGAKDYTFGEFYFVRSFGRLAAGYSPMLAKAETDVVYQARGRHGEDSEVAFTPFPRYFKKAESEKLYLVWAAVALVLIIAVANIAHLLVLRTIGRRSELAVRLALGARLSDLLRQLLLETSMYVSLGGALGLWLAIHATRLLVSRFAIDIPPFATIGLNGRVLVFTALTSLGSALILTFVCTFVASRMRTSEWLHDQSGGLVTGRGRARARDFLVAGQLALAVLLLVCGGLTSRTLIRLHAVDLGIQADNTLSMEIWPPETPGRSFPAPQTIASYTNSLLDRMRRLPGFVSAAVTQLVPLAPGGPHRVFVIEEGGIASQLAPRQRGVFRFSVTSDYFRTMGVPLLYGSDLSDSFLPTAPCPAVIDNTFAQRFWPGQDPTGERFTSRDDHYRVVGVCTAVKKSPKLDAPLPAFYVPFAKYPPVFSSLVVRSESDANSTKQAMKEAVLAIDKSHPPSEARTITELFNQQTSSERSAALLFNGLAVLGLFLACLGVYGTVSYWVTGRRREIGVRMALGAQKGLIAWLVLKRSLIIGAAGLAGGIALALSATRYLESILWGVSPTDAVTYLTGCLILVLVVLAASYLPLRRAMGVDPAFALRHE